MKVSRRVRVRKIIRPKMVNTKKRDNKTFNKGSKSKTKPNELDFSTKKSSKYHVIAGREIKSMGRPFVGSRRANVNR